MRTRKLLPRGSLLLAAVAGSLTCLISPPGFGQSPPGQPLGCLIEPERSAEVGASLGGVVDSVSVDRGQAVKRGQVLATLRSEVERANVESARSRAGAEAEIQAAQATREVAKLKLKKTYDLLQLGFSSQLELDQVKGEFEVADQRLAQAREARGVAVRELAASEAQLRQRTVRSPFDGVIVDRFVQPGERVDGKPLFKLAALDPLRVEVIVPASYYGQLKEGQTIAVQPDFAGAPSVDSKVVQVDRLVDAASGTFRARLALPNPKREIPAGLRCKVVLPGAAQTGAAPNAAAVAGSPTAANPARPR